MIVLDTHTVIWILTQPERISKAASAAIAAEGKLGHLPAISSVTLFEIFYARLRKRVQLHVSEEVLKTQLAHWFRPVAIDSEIATVAGTLQPFHSDPIDRIIAATAIVHRCPLITADRRMHESRVCKAIW